MTPLEGGEGEGRRRRGEGEGEGREKERGGEEGKGGGWIVYRMEWFILMGGYYGKYHQVLLELSG